MKIILPIMIFMVIFNFFIYVIRGADEGDGLNFKYIEEWANKANIDTDEIEYIDWGESWIFKFIELPVNAIIFIGNFLIKTVKAVITIFYIFFGWLVYG